GASRLCSWFLATCPTKCELRSWPICRLWKQPVRAPGKGFLKAVEAIVWSAPFGSLLNLDEQQAYGRRELSLASRPRLFKACSMRQSGGDISKVCSLFKRYCQPTRAPIMSCSLPRAFDIYAICSTPFV